MFRRCAAAAIVACAVCAAPVFAADGALGSGVGLPAATGVPWTGAEIAALDAAVDRQIAGESALRGAHAGFYAIDARDGRVLYRRNPDDAFQPASTLKLLVGSVALDVLGPSFRFHTALLATGTRDGGTLNGALVLRGGGDPFLSAADLDAAAAAVSAAGITSVTQGVAVDDSRYEPPGYLPGWSVDDLPYAYAPVVSALAFEHNAVRVVAAAGSDPSTCAGAPVANPPDEGAETIDVAVCDPRAYAADAMQAALRRHGVGVTRGAFTARAPSFAVWTHDSEDLSGVLAGMWLPSDNLAAELLLREIAVASSGAPGTTAHGIAAEQRWLGGLGLGSGAYALADGSGLSVYDRLTPRAAVTILRHDWNGPYRDLVLGDLPIAGVRGTLASSWKGTAAEGRVFAKTGTLSHVAALAGYVASVRHGTVIFALDVDDALGDAAALRAFRGRVLDLLVRA